MNFLNKLLKNTHISNFLKIGPMGAELLYADRQTDNIKKLIVFFCANLWKYLKQDQIQYSSFYSSSYTNSEDKVPINKKATNTKTKFLAISGSRHITRKVSQICGTYIAMHKWQIQWLYCYRHVNVTHKYTKSLGMFAKIRLVITSFIISVHLSIRPSA